MRILLSAYACEPGKGSEPGVGWNWAIELERMGHEVWVITRANNRSAIEAFLTKNPVNDCHFVYYDPPAWISRWKRGRRGLYVFYLLWQLGAYRIAKRLVREIKFDWVHHVTFVAIRLPSMMGLLGIPFMFGPVAGGERAPMALRRTYPWRGWCRDLIRDVLNLWVRLDPFLHVTFNKATRILVTSEQTRQLLPRRHRANARVQIGIGIEAIDFCRQRARAATEAYRVLFVGELLYLKGLHLGLEAFQILRHSIPHAKMTIIGSGPDREWLMGLSRQLGVTDAVEWWSHMPRESVMSAYAEHDVFLFPSLRDSGGMVVLEAMAHGLPVICLDLGGPGVLVDSECGIVVNTAGKGEEEVVENLAKALIALQGDEDQRAQLGACAKNRAISYRWSHLVREILKDFIASANRAL